MRPCQGANSAAVLVQRTAIRLRMWCLIVRRATAASSAALMLSTNLSAQRPWCRRHLDMQEDCHSCQMSFALTASMADAGLRVPARPDSVRLQLSTLGQSYTILVLPTMSVRDLKTELAHRFNWNVWEIKLYVGSHSLGDHELVESFCTQTISAVISSSTAARGDAPLRAIADPLMSDPLSGGVPIYLCGAAAGVDRFAAMGQAESLTCVVPVGATEIPLPKYSKRYSIGQPTERHASAGHTAVLLLLHDIHRTQQRILMLLQMLLSRLDG